MVLNASAVTMGGIFWVPIDFARLCFTKFQPQRQLQVILSSSRNRQTGDPKCRRNIHIMHDDSDSHCCEFDSRVVSHYARDRAGFDDSCLP